ncbi:hydroxyacid dehydrogenase [bacterium]|nr:hydroxyacid dehydrogenase [bacterium]
MKIVSFYNEEWEKGYLKEKLSDFDILFPAGTVQDNPDFRDEFAEILSVFVKDKVDARSMDMMPKLKLIATRSTGFDHIDLSEAKKRGIIVSNVPTYGENTVAEMAFALLLTLSRRVYDGYKQVVEETNFSPKGLTGFDLKGRTLGVVGTGHIGEYAIRIGKGFGMDVVAFDVHHNDALAGEIGFRYAEFDELLGVSDVITLHVPYNPHTHHMIHKGNIEKIKKGAVLINTSRGAVVETAALIEGLEKGILYGAGLDVLEEEGHMIDHLSLLRDEHPNPISLQTVLQNQYLIDHPRVIITPHNAFNTTEALERILDTTIQNIEGFKEGKPMNIVEAS